MLTGDASADNLNNIINEYYCGTEYLDAVKKFFSKVACIISPYDSYSDNPFIWFKYIIKYSKYSALFMLSESSNINNNNNLSIEKIEDLYECIENSKKKNK